MAQSKSKVNQEIKSPYVILIDAEGTQKGRVSLEFAMLQAKKEGKDLVQVSYDDHKGGDPVVKILDYSKHIYHKQKKVSTHRKKNKARSLKEIKMRFSVDKNDRLIREKAMKSFFEKGHSVRLCIPLRGREIAKKDLALSFAQDVVDSLSDVSKIDNPVRFEGNSVFVTMSPLSLDCRGKK